MEHVDRLTSLLERFHLRITPVPLDAANLAAFADGDARRLILSPHSGRIAPEPGTLLFALSVDFGGPINPLLTALPERVEEQPAPAGMLDKVTTLLAEEYAAPRCGAPVVLARLGEVLVVQILRSQIERGVATTGLLAGLGHPRISHALVAMHDAPDQPWHNADLARIAGLSPSRFKEVFATTVGATPAGYLRRWRLTLARRDLEKGDRVDRVAHRFGYSAPDAFSRAFLREFGVRPSNATRH